MIRPAGLVVFLFAAISLARALEGALGLVLHTGLRGPDLLAAAVDALGRRPGTLALATGVGVAIGLVLWLGLAVWRARAEAVPLAAAATVEADTFAPLWILPLTTFLGALALALRADWPYAHTLAVAFTQDLAPVRDVLVLGALVARRVPSLSLPAPRAGEVFFVSFVAYALLTPDWARQWDSHPGNEPKYLRMAVALGHRLSLDVEPVSAAMEDLEPTPLGEAVAAASSALGRESLALLKALSEGPAAVGKDAIRATRITRQTIGGKDGGVFHVLAPGPSLLLAPTLRADRALNLRAGSPGRLAVSVLLMNVLGALLVMAVFQLARDATGRPGLAAAAAFAFGLLPPFLFYFFQFYPEMPGALVLAVLFRWLFLRDHWSATTAWAAGFLLGSLPWLHQKFLPVWFVLGATALWQAHRGGASRRVWWGLLLPQAASLYLTALYNFGIAGSVRPDALFLAWGPAGVTTARLGQGLLGLWLDARYGLLPFAPAYALGLAGLLVSARGPARRLWGALPAAVVYYLTVAAADNWAGAVCNLGRYLMPILPLVVAFAVVALDRAAARRGVLAVVLGLFAISGLAAFALWQDPHAANDSALLLAGSRFADGFQYIPGLFIRTWAAGAPGLVVRIAVWILLLAGLCLWLARATRGQGGASALRAAYGLLAVVFGAALLLERWPGRREGPALGPQAELGEKGTVFLQGPVRVREDVFEAGPGVTALVLRSRDGVPTVKLLAGGTGLLSMNGAAPVALRPQGVLLDLPLELAAEVRGAQAGRERVATARIRVLGPPAALRFPEAQSVPVVPESVEPPPAEDR